MMTRRRLLEGAGITFAGSALGQPRVAAHAASVALSPGVPAGLEGAVAMETLPGKKPLIKLSYRPPNYESPLDYFDTPITPNDRFYVRFSNRPFGVKRFQTIHHCGVDVAHGLVLLFGIGT